jgi:4-amino-4-deoxy-L-arabinose transferase-like glycosyltransferase
VTEGSQKRLKKRGLADMLLKYAMKLFLLIAFFSLIRLGVAPYFGLGVDEAHYVLYGLYPDWSYVDHPPLVGWIHGLVYLLFGTSEFLARLPAVILSALVSYLVHRFTLRFSHSEEISLLAVLAISSSFLLNGLSLMLLPDSILLLLVLLLIHVVVKMEESPKATYFISLGLILGLSGLAKYTAALLVPALLVYLLIKRRADLIFSSKMLGALLIALLLVTPVFYWNFQHDWISFRYQGQRVFGSSGIKLEPLLTSLLAQAGFYSPFLFGIALYGFYKSFRVRNDSFLLSLLLGGAFFAFCLYAALHDVALPHWASVFYLLFIPVGVYFLSLHQGKVKKRLRNLSIGISLVITLALYAELAGKWFSFPAFQSPFRDIYGWPTIAREGDAALSENPNPKKAFAVTEWTFGSRMIYYALPYQREVFILDSRKDQFDLWQENSPDGYDLLFVHSRFSDEDILKKFRCDEGYTAKKINLVLNNAQVDQIDYIWCKNFQGARNDPR